MSKTTPPGKVFTMRLDPALRTRLRRLKTATGKGSEVDVMRDALAAYDTIMTASENGVEFSFKDSKSGKSGLLWLLPAPPPFKS